MQREYTNNLGSYYVDLTEEGATRLRLAQFNALKIADLERVTWAGLRINEDYSAYMHARRGGLRTQQEAERLLEVLLDDCARLSSYLTIA